MSQLGEQDWLDNKGGRWVVRECDSVEGCVVIEHYLAKEPISGELEKLLSVPGEDKEPTHDVHIPAEMVPEITTAMIRVGEQKCFVRDDPQWDCTDYAHPAWWRGHDWAGLMVTRYIVKVLDGKDDGSGTANSAELEAVRRRIMELMRKAG